jgi:small subunit ribosomal protein S8
MENGNTKRKIIPRKYIKRNNDPFGDVVSRIKNAHARMFDEVILPGSHKTKKLLDAFIRSGYILSYYEEQESKDVLPSCSSQNYIIVSLKYHDALPAIRNIQRTSSPGKRIFLSKKDIVRYSKLQSWGASKTMFLSTSKGIFSHNEILKSSVLTGGETLCIIW